MGLNEKLSKIFEKRTMSSSSNGSNNSAPPTLLRKSDGSSLERQINDVVRESSIGPSNSAQSIIAPSMTSLVTTNAQRRVSFPTICASKVSENEPVEQSPSGVDNKSIGSDSAGSSAILTSPVRGKSSDITGWLTKKISTLISQVNPDVENVKVVSMLTRTLNRATGSKKGRNSSRDSGRSSSRFRFDIAQLFENRNKQVFPVRYSSESVLMDLFKNIPESPYRQECRSIIDRYGLIVDNTNDEFLLRLVEGCQMMEDDMDVMSPCVWQNLTGKTEPIDFIDDEYDERTFYFKKLFQLFLLLLLRGVE